MSRGDPPAAAPADRAAATTARVGRKVLVSLLSVARDTAFARMPWLSGGRQ